jgi:membrane dipeptidase
MKTEPTLTVSDKARELLNNTLVWDMTLPWEPNAMDRTTLPRFKAAGFDVVSLTMDMETLGATVRHIAMVLADIRVHSDTMTLVGNHDEVLEARKAGKLALVLHLQETNPLDGEIDMIEVFYELGVRHMLLAYNPEEPGRRWMR